MERTRTLIGLTLVGVLAFTGIFIAGCNPNPAQIKTIAQQAGLFSAVGWIAMDNPAPEVKTAVTGAIKIIGENADKVEEGKTYTEVMYPIILNYVIKEVDPQYRPLTKAGSIALLGGIDMIFASNPEWAEKEGLVVDIVQSFCLGASSGLAMAADDPVIKAATRSAHMRSGLKLGR